MQLYKNKTLLFVDFSKVFGRKIYQKPQKYDIIISRREGMYMWTAILSSKGVGMSKKERKLVNLVIGAVKMLGFIALLFIVWALWHF